MITRRELLEIGAATAAFAAGAGIDLRRAVAQQAITQSDLLKFPSVGNVTLLHFADLHAQLRPVYLREPSVNLGVGEAKGLVPHLTGELLLGRYGIAPGSREAYALSSDDYIALAKTYGRIGGLDRIATAVKAVRAERGNDRVLLLDGGDSLQGSLGANRTRGQDVANCLKLLDPDAMTGHWEFTYGEKRLKELIKGMDVPFLAANVRDTEWQEPVFDAYQIFEKAGVAVAVIGQAFPYTPVANPRWMMPHWTFGIREESIRAAVAKARREGASLVVLLSHDGFDVDRKLASRVLDIDVILTSHTHDALPEPVKVGRTLLIASGSYGKFLSRLDLDVRAGGVRKFEYRLIPLLADVIAPDPEMSAQIEKERAPFKADLERVAGQTESLLYRRGTFEGTFDDVICDAIRQERDAEIALSPGFRWGATVPPGSPITVEDIHNATAITYPQVYRTEMNGERLKAILEDVADNLFNPDPYYQQGGDMVRTGGLSFTIDVNKPMGQRISNLAALKTGKAIEAGKNYVVTGWASVNEGVDGPPIWDVVEKYIKDRQTVRVEPTTNIKVVAS
jgi:sulfur-oxidizing protein SoxB